jgi:hypothetical protein
MALGFATKGATGAGAGGGTACETGALGTSTIGR